MEHNPDWVQDRIDRRSSEEQLGYTFWVKHICRQDVDLFYYNVLFSDLQLDTFITHEVK